MFLYDQNREDEAMISKQDLQEYSQIMKLIESLDLQIEQEYNTYKSPSFSSGVRSNDPSDPVTRALARISRMKEERAELVSRKTEIENFIDSIPDLKERAICSYRYLLGYTWRATCQTLQGHTSYAMLMEYDRNWWNTRTQPSEDMA